MNTHGFCKNRRRRVWLDSTLCPVVEQRCNRFETWTRSRSSLRFSRAAFCPCVKRPCNARSMARALVTCVWDAFASRNHRCLADRWLSYLLSARAGSWIDTRYSRYPSGRTTHPHARAGGASLDRRTPGRPVACVSRFVPRCIRSRQG
ncbi:Permease of the drug/metabolite transporter (DMT) superfamily [Caballeronia sordidicola]|uniref:Permease of the drug/metabolite transporter (DMT) superfamily n=1 Tax=Caballeronia sordidicola TaxID=196367 RepID=A0A226WVK2_CABSO|nr:Permease of the drug/metabolite transporter (DMT) superfamily [Caballeronia sordidicola]